MAGVPLVGPSSWKVALSALAMGRVKEMRGCSDRLPGHGQRHALLGEVTFAVQQVDRADHPVIGHCRQVEVRLEPQPLDFLPIEEDRGDLLDGWSTENGAGLDHRLEIAVDGRAA